MSFLTGGSDKQVGFNAAGHPGTDNQFRYIYAKTFTLTSVGNPSNFVSVYTGTITGGDANAYEGVTFVVSGFSNSGNNGTFICVASTATTLSLYFNTSGASETHAATTTSTPFLALGPSFQGIPVFPSFPLSFQSQLMLATAEPAPFFAPAINLFPTGIGYASTWQNNGIGDDVPAFLNKNFSPTTDPAFAFQPVIELDFVTDPTYSGDASGSFIAALDMNNSFRSPAHFGQTYAMFVEHGANIANGGAIHIDDFRRIYVESLWGNGGALSNSVYNIGYSVNFNCATGGFSGSQSGLVGLSRGINIEGPRLGSGLASFGSHMGIRMASQQQGNVQGTFVITSVASAVALATLTLTSVATAGSDSTAIYTGTITGGGGNAFVGYYLTMAGFTTTANNGTFFVVASNATTLTVINANAVAETHAATATQSTSTYTGTIPGGAANALAGQVFTIAGFTNTGSALVLTAANNATFGGFLTGQTTYTGTITGGAANAFFGRTFTVAGFVTGGNNGTFLCMASSATTLTLANANGAGETHAGTATPQVNNGLFKCAGSSATTLVLNNWLGTSETHAATATGRNAAAWGIHQDDSLERNALGTINLGGESGPLFSAGTGSPESVVISSVGGVYLRKDGDTLGDPIYVKGVGSSNTGWAPVSTIGPTVTKVTTYTATNADGTINCNGTFTLTLPTTSLPVGKFLRIKNIGVGTITVASAANIDGSPSQTITTQYSGFDVQWDGTTWWIY